MNDEHFITNLLNGSEEPNNDGYSPGSDPAHTAWVRSQARQFETRHRADQRRKRQLPKTAAGLEEALRRLDVAVRYNVRACRPEFRNESDDWEPSNDRLEASLQERIATAFLTTAKKPGRLVFGRECWTRSLNAILAEVEVDPFIQFLEALPPWDGTERVDSWLSVVFTTETPRELVRWAARFLLLGPIHRAVAPGSKLDEMPVLIGPQGSGKSTAVRLVLPPERPEFFGDGIQLAGDPRTRVEALQGRVIVEASEMVGATRADLASLSAFLTRTDDGSVRLAFRRNPESLPRRCIIVGTADKECLPNDSSGTRRFVAISVARGSGGGVPALREFLDKWRLQLWAEALVEYRNGSHPRLPDTLVEEQRSANQDFRIGDDLLEDAVERWTVKQRDPFTLAAAASGCGLVKSEQEATQIRVADQRRLGSALAAAGFRKKRERVNGRRVVRWYRVEEEE